MNALDFCKQLLQAISQCHDIRAEADKRIKAYSANRTKMSEQAKEHEEEAIKQLRAKAKETHDKTEDMRAVLKGIHVKLGK